VTVGGLNEVQVFRTDDFSKVATIAVGKLPHGVWPSGDGSRVYVGLENDDQMIAIDTMTNEVIAAIPIGQAPQAVAYVPNAVPATNAGGNNAMSVMGDLAAQGTDEVGLRALGIAGQAAHLTMVPPGPDAIVGAKPPTSVTLFDQGLVQVLEASITGLEPMRPYVLALATKIDGAGTLEPISSFMTNPAGSAIVNAVGPIRQVVRMSVSPRLYLVIVTGSPAQLGRVVQMEAP
jgi:YVTN family beta-propeller protein